MSHTDATFASGVIPFRQKMKTHQRSHWTKQTLGHDKVVNILPKIYFCNVETFDWRVKLFGLRHRDASRFCVHSSGSRSAGGKIGYSFPL